MLVSLIGIAGAQLNFARGQDYQWDHDLGERLDRDQYHFDEVIFETIPTTPGECASIIRPILDQDGKCWRKSHVAYLRQPGSLHSAPLIRDVAGDDRVTAPRSLSDSIGTKSTSD